MRVSFPAPNIAPWSLTEFHEERKKHPGYFRLRGAPLRSSRTIGSPVRVHIEVQKFSNLKISFIFSNKEEGSIPASAVSTSFTCLSPMMGYA